MKAALSGTSPRRSFPRSQSEGSFGDWGESPPDESHNNDKPRNSPTAKTSEGQLIVYQEDMYTHVFLPIEEEKVMKQIITDLGGNGLQIYGCSSHRIYSKSQL